MSWTYSNEHMKPLYLGLSFTFFFFIRHDCSPRTQPIFGGVRVAWNKSQKSLIVSTAGLFAWNLTSLTLCYYVIGLLHRVQTNHKHKMKRMWFSCEQPFLWGSIAWHPKKTTAEDTRFDHLENFFYIWPSSIQNIFLACENLLKTLMKPPV